MRDFGAVGDGITDDTQVIGERLSVICILSQFLSLLLVFFTILCPIVNQCFCSVNKKLSHDNSELVSSVLLVFMFCV